ncbi:GATA transcription factor 9 [Actinidia rufa]|uniref:GATA transcription factor 9 n=1 Tax=Actinidia rufa TaxID=165716 RepID=A0A7J0GCG1_9ERIC|nr:GATA transcription factor 9 [Actinidia rufa]
MPSPTISSSRTCLTSRMTKMPSPTARLRLPPPSPPAITAVNSCNSSFSGSEPHFSGDVDLCVPYDDLAELEWLSNFVEESFSSEDLQKFQIISGAKARPEEGPETHEFAPEDARPNPVFNRDVSVPGKARSKRSRAAPCDWASRLSVLSPNKSMKQQAVAAESGGDGRKCLHCATDKTPQWRTGPMGPKTLCNACGVRFKSGRLVPEYRPASSPTFVLTKHSNSHRKVMELRRQKEMQLAQSQTQAQLQHQPHQFINQNVMFDVSNGEDYLIHQHVGPDFRQLI